jgi:hypothetical protein
VDGAAGESRLLEGQGYGLIIAASQGQPAGLSVAWAASARRRELAWFTPDQLFISFLNADRVRVLAMSVASSPARRA